ncbi:MAG: TetR/AcrR family transcriptional regulator [Evtepia sp.]
MTKEDSVRNRLVRAGLQELNQYGVQNFSVRRVATACDVSCAAPYKHFKDKESYIAAIIQYGKEMWAERQLRVLERLPNSRRAQLVEISLEYVRFLVENPYFRSIIMLTNAEFDDESLRLRGRISETTQTIVKEYCAEVGMSKSAAKFKLYVVISLIYGAALMFDNGGLEYNEENMDLVAHGIKREFELP